MKALVKSTLARLGYRLEGMRHVPRQLRDANGLRLVEFDDLVCRRMFEVGSALTFVQVGAFDGVTKDPLRRYIESCGWRGIMIEPQQSAAAKLRSLYAVNEGVEIVEAAIDRQCGARTLFTVEKPGAPDWCGGLASFDRETILRHSTLVPDLEHMIDEQRVETTTFNSVLARLSGRDIDILQMDAEGADAFLLSLFPFEQVRPAIVHWEVKHLTMAEREATLDRLLPHGYQFAPSGSENMLAALF